MGKLSMTSKEALEVLIDAKHCRNAEHEKEVNEAIEVLRTLVDKTTNNDNKLIKAYKLLDEVCNADGDYMKLCEKYERAIIKVMDILIEVLHDENS